MTDKPIIFSGPMVRALLDGRKTQTRRLIKPQPVKASTTGLPVPVYSDDWSWPLKAPGCSVVSCKPFPPETYLRDYPLRYAPGDRLYVQENWRACRSLDRLSPSDMRAQCLEAGYRRAWAPVLYEADGATVNFEGDTQPGRFRSPRHMLREFSRLTLTVTDVRVERLQEISEEDARAEGVEPLHHGFYPYGLATWLTTTVNGREVPAQCCPTARLSFERLWNSLHGPDAWALNPWVAAYTFTVERRNIDAGRP